MTNGEWSAGGAHPPALDDPEAWVNYALGGVENLHTTRLHLLSPDYTVSSDYDQVHAAALWLLTRRHGYPATGELITWAVERLDADRLIARAAPQARAALSLPWLYVIDTIQRVDDDTDYPALAADTLTRMMRDHTPDTTTQAQRVGRALLDLYPPGLDWPDSLLREVGQAMTRSPEHWATSIARTVRDTIPKT